MEPLVRVVDVCCHYDQRQVLDAVRLDLFRGEICVLLGPNGSGKSTLLNCISGLIPFSKGSINIVGHHVDFLSVRERAKLLAILVQDVPESFPYSVTDMVVMGRTPHLSVFERPTQEDFVVAREIIASLGIEHLADRSFTDLSGGERQMVRLARALAQQSEILLLDEPTAHLDIRNTWLMLTKIRDMALEKGLTVLAAMHDPNLVAGIATRVIMLDEGRLYRDGPPTEIITAQNLSSLYRIPLEIVPIANNRTLVFHPLAP